jgi:small ligand-binding sensory domain FIST
MEGAPGDAERPRYASALSEHPVSTQAATYVAQDVLQRVGPSPELAVLFVTPPHREAVDEVVDVIRTLLQPGTLLGATAVAVLGGRREVEQEPAVSLFAARSRSPIRPIRLSAQAGDDGWSVSGIPDDLGGFGSLLLLADPFTFPVDAMLQRLRSEQGGLAVVGGMASAAVRAGDNRLLLDELTFPDGAVGVLLGDDVSPQAVVSQGCRPIGRPYIVTRADGQMIYELGGKPALERLLATLGHLSPADNRLAEQGLHCGIVIDERKEEFDRGDFLIRGVLGVDRESGAVAVGDVVSVGATVQFQVRDARSADEDLRELLAGRAGHGALVFTCNGRGQRLFGTPDHDASVVSDLLGTSTVAGMFCAGELGPVGGRNALHGFTASLAIFR